MEIQYYPDKKSVEEAQQVDDPLLMLVEYERNRTIVSNIDHSVEHVILLKKAGYHETDIDKYYRIVVNQDGADWTFVCPSNYRGIKDQETRLKQFYNDGVDAISSAIRAIGYCSEINIPKRYRRHFNMLGEF